MNETKKTWIIRIIVGGVIGMVVMAFLGLLFNSFADIRLTSSDWDWVSYDLIKLVGSKPLATLLQFGLYFALGAGVGVATLPFAEEGKDLLIRSALHFVYTAAVSSALIWLCGWNRGEPVVWLIELALLALLYALVWLGRLAAWWSELDAIREKLGLAPVPSPLRWRETMPSLGFALLLCLVVPLALRFFDPPDVPVLTGMLWPWVLVPVGGFMGGLSLGKRHGFCPLYLAACVLLALTATLLLNNSDPLINGGVALAAALAGNLSGAARHRRKQRKGAPASQTL